MNTSKFQDKREIRKNVIYLSVFLFLIGFVWMLLGKKEFLYFYLVSLFILVIGFFLPVIIKPVFIILNYVSFYLGKINSKILLILFFYFFITPIGFLLRLIRKNPLDLKIKKDIKSYWIKRIDAVFQKEDFKNQF